MPRIRRSRVRGYFPLLPAGGNPIYYVEDLLGTSRVLTTNTGIVCYDADFYPYGGERSYTNTCPQNNYKFEGKERDTETGNDDFGARYYSNRFGRWLSADWSSVPVPVPYANLTNPQTLNLYSMVADDPESFADLDGHETNSQGGADAQSAMNNQVNCNTGTGSPATCNTNASTTQALDQQQAEQAKQQAQNQSQSQTQQNQQQSIQQPVQGASAGVLALGIGARALLGAQEGAQAGAAAGTAEPGGGNVAGAVIGAVAGAAVAALAPTIYSKSKDEAQKAWTKLKTAVDHLGPTKLGGPARNPRGGWKQTLRRIANDMDKHADRMTGHQGTANAIRLAADFVRGLAGGGLE